MHETQDYLFWAGVPVRQGDATGHGLQDGSRPAQGDMRLVPSIKLDGLREALGGGPEQGAGGGDGILGEGVHQLSNAIVELMLQRHGSG